MRVVKDLIDGDELHIYVARKIDESEELPTPTSLLINVIPDEDIDQELRSFRPERRNKRNPNPKKKKKNKKDRYVSELGGDEQYIDSLECGGDDSTNVLDVEAIRGVDHEGRVKKIRYDDEYEVDMKVIKIITITFKESDSIRYVKSLLHDEEGIIECLQLLFSKDVRLIDDEQKLMDCGIIENSTLDAHINNSFPKPYVYCNICPF
ncbi:hypothetical protein RDI58_001183 [Solanum bulbocastanum]|uniref:Ubiquitin-like domain-containing protein n=1 Tax=Solanum bulbocastanum TaxID=147425 RepID=A0AAN8YPV8_SOLBU